MSQPSYEELAQRGQEVFRSAMDAWSKTVQDALNSGPARVAAPAVDPQQLVDQVFEFAESMLAMQRDLTKTLIENTVALQQGLAAQTTEAKGKPSEAKGK